MLIRITKLNDLFGPKIAGLFLIKFFNHSELDLVISFVSPTSALAPQQMQVKALAPRKMLGFWAPSSGSPALLVC